MGWFVRIGSGWCIRDVLLFAFFCHSNLGVPTEAADEDELGQIGGAGGGGRKGLYSRCEDVKKCCGGKNPREQGRRVAGGGGRT
jgi:hypothetical protein